MHYPRALLGRPMYVRRGRLNQCFGPNHHDDINVLDAFKPNIDAFQMAGTKLLPKPNDARPQQPISAGWTKWDFNVVGPDSVARRANDFSLGLGERRFGTVLCRRMIALLGRTLYIE
jgi:hypothetical protein